MRLIKQSFIALILLACAACGGPPQFVQDAGGIEGFRQQVIAAHPPGSKSSDLAEELQQLGFRVERYPEGDLKTFRPTGRHNYAGFYPIDPRDTPCWQHVRVEWTPDRNEKIEKYDRVVVGPCAGP
jgi:hypothetical protein